MSVSNVAFVSILVLASSLGTMSAVSAQTCTSEEAKTTGCVVGHVSDDGVTLTGTEQRPGSGDGSPQGAGDDAPPATDGGGPRLDPSAPRDSYTVTALVTLADIAQFHPTPGTDHMEPNGWMVVGLDTNFYAVASTQVQEGQLLGRSASVRFTPRTYRWAYGDGSSATRAAKGSTWAAQGIAEFDPTPTSHVYRAKGTYTIDLTVGFRAEYRYDSGGWIPIAGTLAVPANRLVATAGDAKTVLVAKDCSANPFGPGC
jgi:hypothetical protein